jgi:hypothetical protein
MPGDDLVKSAKSLTIRQQAELVLRLPAHDRLKFVLDAPKPMAVTRALPDSDFYLTVREVGPQDAIPLLALASTTQIAHLLDLESWRRDRFDPTRCGAWVALLVEAGEATIRRFARTIDDETLILLFRLWARVTPLDIDHEEPTRGHGITEVGDERGFISPDGANLFAPERTEHAPAVRNLAEMLFHEDRSRYLGIIRSALFELPSEVEETALHWRVSRLEEHGYPTWDEALSIYAPPAKDASSAWPAPPAVESEGPVAPRLALQAIGADTPIVPSLDALAPGDLERVLHGLTALSNRVLVADGADAGSMEAQRAVMERTGAYVGIALQARGVRDGAAGARALRDVTPIELFREGYAKTVALRARARAMLATGWGHGYPKAEELLEAPLRARVRGASAPHPLYVELADDGPGDPRPFRSLAEIDETHVTLDLCETLGEVLLTRRGTTAAVLLAEERRPFEDVPRFGTLLLTALGWHAARGRIAIDRLPSDAVADFLRTTASRRTADPEAPGRAMSRLVDALAGESGLTRLPAAALRLFGSTCLDRLAADCGNLDPGSPVTPRVVGCLRLA